MDGDCRSVIRMEQGKLGHINTNKNSNEGRVTIISYISIISNNKEESKKRV